jgi:hypothetical protein
MRAEEKNLRLSESHHKMLSQESGISDAVIEERGYRTISDHKELSRLGFSPRETARVTSGTGSHPLSPTTHVSLLAPMRFATTERPACWVRFWRGGKRHFRAENTSAESGDLGALCLKGRPEDPQKVTAYERYFFTRRCKRQPALHPAR